MSMSGDGLQIIIRMIYIINIWLAFLDGGGGAGEKIEMRTRDC